ncbi:MAG: hypothetical protein D6729_17800, partial [Deltaproteobacteria bacterium]
GDLDGALALLEEAERRDFAPPDLADLAAAIATNVPDPASVLERLKGDARFLGSAHRAALLATLTERTGRIRDAAFYWEVAARQQPDEVTWHRQLARIYAVTGQMSRLTEALRAVVRLAPKDEAARTDLVRRLTASGDVAGARAAAWVPEGDLPEGERRRLAARVLLRGGRPEDAIAVYQQILGDAPDDCESQVGLARAQIAAGRTQAGAKRLWRLLLDRGPAPPCRPAEVTRLLLAHVPGAARRLRRLLRVGRLRDAETVESVLAAAGPKPRR